MARWFLLLSIFLSPSSAWARGGRCSSIACTASASIVLGALLLLFVVSLISSIRRQGVWKTLASHRVLQWFVGYVGSISILAGGAGVAHRFLGKEASAIWVAAVVVALLVGIRMRTRRLRQTPRTAPSAVNASDPAG